MTMQIVTCSRRCLYAIEFACYYVVISITDPPPDGEPIKIPKHWGLRGELHVAFHDFDPGKYKRELLYDGKPLIDWAMQASHAEEIAQFVRKHLGVNGVTGILIHCEAGVSRSPSIALAIADALCLSRACIDSGNRPPEHPPNPHVYQTMWNALNAAHASSLIDRARDVR